jgi:hypothetical protein
MEVAMTAACVSATATSRMSQGEFS